MNNAIDWRALRAEFDPADVSFRLQGNPREGKTSAVVVAYLDSRAVQDRLDEVCGPDGWAFDWQPVVTSGSAVLAAKGTLTIAGVSKSDVGDAGQTEPTKASVSDALKRTAVQWGIGRYLYNLPLMFAECVKSGNSWVMAKGEEERLRRTLPKPASQNAPVRASQPQQPAVTTEAPSTPTPPDLMTTTIASAQEQRDLAEKLRKAGYGRNAANLLLAETSKRVKQPLDVAAIATGESDLTLRELAIISQRLASMPANGKAAAR